MGDYSSWENTPWYNLTKYHAINNVNISGDITYIGKYAFANPSIGSASLPSKLERIGIGAFQGSSISSLVLSSSLKIIEDEAFYNCKYLTDIALIYGLETIGKSAFANCKSMSLLLAENIKEIGDYAFLGCNVKSFTPSTMLTYIGTGAFSKCAFTSLKLPDSIKYIGHAAFSDPNIKKIQIGSGLTTIIGTPFYSATKGELWINKNNPISLSTEIVENSSNWTLYVPNGSKNVYSKASYWKNFKTISETTTLTGDGEDIDQGNPNDNDHESNYTGKLNGYDWVDLGLSVKWATFNVGAKQSSDPGEYFLWGHSTTNWETDNGSLAGENWAGNTNNDPISKLWGRGWKTPTKEEFEELINNCKFSIVKENGISCIKATSQKNKQSIIIPLSGRMEGFRDYGDTYDELTLNGSVAFLWSASSSNNNGNYVAYFFQIESSALTKATCSYRSLCTNIYQYYKRIPMRGVCQQ